MSEAPQTLDGWYALHDYRSIDWTRWQALSEQERTACLEELLSCLDEFESVNANHSGSFGWFSVVGHKADLLWLHMRPTVKELFDVKLRFNQTRFAAFTTAPYSYLSVVELGSYLAKPGVDPDTDPYLQSRLKPEIPAMSHICFYPMNKKREGDDNWFMLPKEDRSRLLRAHSAIGQQYAGQLKQIITGSMGLDDWEWGVTLFSDDPLQFKKIIYEMRYDESSARFAEFGPFLVGHRLTTQDAAQVLRVGTA